MPRLLTFFSFSLLLILLWPLQSLPQNNKYSFRHLTTKQGLPSNLANSVIKGSDGFMWFGTGNGLARYDGYNFKTYQVPDDSMSGSSNQTIIKILEYSNRNILVGTSHRGLFLFDKINETFSCCLLNPTDPNDLSHNIVNTLYQDKKATIWIGTNEGLFKFYPENNTFKSYKQEADNPDSLKDQVLSIFEDRTGTFWIGTADGVYLFDRQREIFTKFNLGNEIPEGYFRKVTCFFEDRDGIIWIGTLWGLFKYDKGTKELTNYLPQGFTQSIPGKPDPNSYISNIHIESIIETNLNKEHLLWIATHWGLNKFNIDNEQFEVFLKDKRYPKGISSNFLLDLYLDDAGMLWIATVPSGLEVLNIKSNPFNQVKMDIPGTDYYYEASCFLLDNDEWLWVGGINDGIFQYDKDFDLRGNYAHWKPGNDAFNERKRNNIHCIYQDPDDILWLGYFLWGLVIFDRERKTFRQIELQNNTGAPLPDEIDNIIQDQFGILWVGSNSGLYIKNRNKPIFSPAEIISHDVLSKADITMLFQDKKDNLWVSTRKNGLFCLRPDNRDSLIFIRYLNNQKDQNGFFGNFVSTAYEDQNGTLWFGSDQGLQKFNFLNNKFEPENRFNENYAGLIIEMYGDNQNYIWIFHETMGLVRYNPSIVNENYLKKFDTRDGLPFDDFNTVVSFINTFYQSDDGRLFIASALGSGDGFFWFHPDSLKENTNVPRLEITNFKVGNKRFSLDSTITLKKHITLKYNENFFSFEFAALDFTAPEENQYAWYLEGLENEWNYAGNQRTANYTAVLPGEYIFRVKGSNNDGYWNEKGTSVHISILPPFWKTWWAYIVYGLVFIAVVYSIIHYYLRRQRLLHSLEIEHVEAEKLKEMDSMKSRFFANISHEFRTPLTLIIGPLKNFINKTTDVTDKQELSVMQRNAHRLQDLINQLLNLSKLEAGKMHLQARKLNIVSLVKNYIQSFESLARQRNISLIFNTDKDEIEAYFDREKIEQVLNNLLSNAFKFTGDGGEIEVGIVRADIPLNPPSKGDLPPTGQIQEKPQTPPLPKGAGGIPDREIQITVSDTGRGIPPEKLEHIFDRFYQADDSQTRHYEGTGIGLALVKELVELHHGHITAENRVEKGTTFTVTILLGKDHLMADEIIEAPGHKTKETSHADQQEEEPITDLPEQKQSLKEEENGLPIMLIVEDNPDMRKYIGRFFNTDYQLIEAGNGKEGMDRATDHIPDIIISDVMMPEMDGNEFCQKIKADERTSHIPVILLTARAAKESRLKGLETGADDFITKPFDGEELQVRVKNLIDQRKKLQEKFMKNATKIGLSELMKLPDSGIASIDQKFLQKAVNVVEENIQEPEFSIEKFAGKMAISRMQLHRKLRALTDQSASKFIRAIRLNRAAQLLLLKSANVSEIALEVGFNSLSWFTRSFQEQFGMSPKEYIAEKN